MADRLTQEQIAAVKQMDLSCEMPILCARKPFETWCLDCLLSAILAHIEASDSQLSLLARRAARIYAGFEMESGNGVVCSIPDEGIDAVPHRTWCAVCQARYRALHQLALDLSALVEGRSTRIVAPDERCADTETCATWQSKLAQAEAALRAQEDAYLSVEAERNAANVIAAKWRDALAEKSATVAQQAERIVQLETAATNAVALIRERYNEHRDPKSDDSDWGQAEDRKCNWCVDAETVFAALAASSAEPPTPKAIKCDQKHGGTPCADRDCHVRFIDNEDESSSLSASGAQDEKVKP